MIPNWTTFSSILYTLYKAHYSLRRLENTPSSQEKMAATNEKQKKAGFMSLYKPAAATGTHRIQLPEPKKPSTKDKNYISRSWLLMRKPKGVRSSQDQVEHGGERVIEQVGGGGDSGGNGGGGGREVVVEGRKSVSHVETNLASVISFLQVKVLVSDMPSFMQVHAFKCARRTYDSLEKFSAKHMAYNMKKVCYSLCICNLISFH